MTARLTKIAKSTTSRKKSSAPTRKFRQKLHSRFKKILVLVLVFFLSAGTLSGYIIFNSLNKQFAGAESSTSLDQSYSALLFVVVDDFSKDTPSIKKLEYKIYDFENKKSYSYNVNPSYKAELQGKFGTEPVSNFLALGALNDDDKVRGGISFVNNAVFSIFAFPVDRYVYVDESNAWAWEGLFKDGQFWPLMLRNRDYSANLNIQLSELYRLSVFVSGLPADRVIDIDIDRNSKETFDENFRDMTLGSRLADEGKSIAVLNATSYAGIASFGARVVNNLGGRVVSVDNAENKFSEDFIVTDKVDDYSVNLLAKVFGITKIIDKESAKQYVTDNQLYRTDILLIFGK